MEKNPPTGQTGGTISISCECLELGNLRIRNYAHMYVYWYIYLVYTCRVGQRIKLEEKSQFMGEYQLLPLVEVY